MLTEITSRTLTAERVLSPAERVLNDIQGVLDYYQDHGLDARLIGSFGRQASLHTEKPIFLKENNSESDIDILLLNSDKNTPAIIKKAHQIAKHDVFTNLFLRREGELFIKYRNILTKVDPKILQLRTGSLAGKPIHTLDLNLLFHLSALYLSMRPKDKISLIKFAEAIKKNKDYLPEELFKPFHILMDLKKERYPLDTTVGKIQYFYLKNVPKPINFVLKPILGTVKKIYVNL